MKIGEDLVCFCYTFLSSIALFYDLGHQSIVTVQCKNSKTFCLEHESHESRVRYTFTAKDLEFRCNTEVISVWVRVLLFLGVLYELVAYGVAVYVYYYKPKTNDVDLGVIFQRCVYTIAGITGLLILLLLLLPFASYILPSGGVGRWGIIAEVWASPLRGLVLLILNIITAPLRWIFYNNFKTELGLNRLYTNFSCVEPSMENALLKCPMELHILPNMPELSYCENDFYCTRDCLVGFPRIVINSLAFIFASLALFYRLLKLTHYITKRETDLIATNVRSNTDTTKDCHSGDSQDRNLRVLDDSSGGDMKQKSVAKSAKTGGCGKGEKDVYPRRNAVRKREGVQENTQQPKANLPSLDGAQARQKTGADKNADSQEIAAQNSTVLDQDRSMVATAKHLELFDFEANLDRSNAPHASSKRFDLEEAKLATFSEQSNLANGRRGSEKREEQNTSLKKLAASKNGGSKHLSRTTKHRVTEESFNGKRNGQTLMNNDSYSEHKTQGKTKKLQGKSTRTTVSNGHLRKEAKVYRRTAKNGASEVKMGSTGDTEGSEEWSSEDIVEGIEGLLVEDESEFYMSGFRL